MKDLKLYIATFALLASTLLLSSCNKNKDKFYTLELEVNYKVAAADFAYDQVYTINGTAVKFQLLQLYMSSIAIEDDGGASNSFADKYLLIKPGTAAYDLGTFSKDFGGHLHRFNFNVGIDSAANSQTTETFTNRAASDPLSAQNPAMYWNQNSGYIFLKIDAMVDTTGDGIVDAAMEYHLGMNSMLRPVNIMAHTDLDKGDNHIHLNFDVAALLADVNFVNDGSTHTTDNMPLAMKIANNLAIAFRKAD
jgi:hypothetical protein